jgi:membrane protease YdiL (CAAX protease family)
MHALAFGRSTTRAGDARPLDLVARVFVAAVCFVVGLAPVAARWIPDAAMRIEVDIVLVVIYVAVAYGLKKQIGLQQLREFWSVALAFGVFALVWLLNDTIPAFFASNVLHDEPTSNNPFASTVSGTVILQLVDMLVTIIPVLLFAVVTTGGPGSVYVRKGVLGRWLVAAIAFFVIFFVFVATLPLRPDSPALRLFPMAADLSVEKIVALSPALLVMALSNGFQEEFLFRGLLLSSFGRFLGPWSANLVQAALFATAHLGVTYTPNVVLFIVCGVLPLGLVAGYLTRKTRSLLTPAIFHGALDIAIYLTFLAAVS